MEAIVITSALAGSVAAAFLVQKAALAGLFLMMQADRRSREKQPAL